MIEPMFTSGRGLDLLRAQGAMGARAEHQRE
jgi:hypothetical protein